MTVSHVLLLRRRQGVHWLNLVDQHCRVHYSYIRLHHQH
jgi:hypothetical protein